MRRGMRRAAPRVGLARPLLELDRGRVLRLLNWNLRRKVFGDGTHGDERNPERPSSLVGQDSKFCIQIAENPRRHHGRTKHIELRIRWIEDEIKKEKLALIYVPTGQMVADVLTKPLSYEAFARHSSFMKGAIFPEMEKKAKRARFE